MDRPSSALSEHLVNALTQQGLTSDTAEIIVQSELAARHAVAALSEIAACVLRIAMEEEARRRGVSPTDPSLIPTRTDLCALDHRADADAALRRAREELHAHP